VKKISDQRSGINNTLRLLSKALEFNSSQIQIIKDIEDKSTVILKYNDLILDSEAAPIDVHKSIAQYLRERSFFWPESDSDQASVSQSTSPSYRILLSTLSGMKCLATVEMFGDPEIPEISITNITKNITPSLVDSLIMPEDTHDAFFSSLRARNGIILVNHTATKDEISGSALILALRPDACFADRPHTPAELEECMSLAKTNLLVLAGTALDPVEQIWSLCAEIKNSNLSVRSFAEQLILSFASKRVRRQCGACAKSTNIPSDTLDKLPAHIKDSLEKTYMASKGCSVCGFSCYRGTIDVSSILVADESIKSWITHGTSESLVLHAYQKGYQSLTEDGFRKVYEGLTSFEEVFENVLPFQKATLKQSNDFITIRQNHLPQKTRKPQDVCLL
jgi:hypothetical protein